MMKMLKVCLYLEEQLCAQKKGSIAYLEIKTELFSSQLILVPLRHNNSTNLKGDTYTSLCVNEPYQQISLQQGERRKRE